MSIIPRISVVTPSFNQQAYLEQTIKSVLNQDYPNLEYIVIDGGSSDDSPNIIKKYSSQLAYWVCEPDRGHAHGLAKGFNYSTGEIMGWINSDDMLTPWCFQSISEIFSKFPHINWIHGTNSWWNHQGQMIKAAKVRKNIYDFLLGDYTWIQQESVFWRRSLWNRAGGMISEAYNYMVDGELWSRFFLHDKLYTVDCILSGYRTYGNNRATLNYSKCIAEMNDIVGIMRSQCPNDVLEDAKKLRLILRLAWKLRVIFGESRALDFLGKTVGKNLFYKTGYDIITWDVSSCDWIEKRISFKSS
jgi:glycosyltransferase involved in cell wall biosynthesis